MQWADLGIAIAPSDIPLAENAGEICNRGGTRWDPSPIGQGRVHRGTGGVNRFTILDRHPMAQGSAGAGERNPGRGALPRLAVRGVEQGCMAGAADTPSLPTMPALHSSIYCPALSAEHEALHRRKHRGRLGVAPRCSSPQIPARIVANFGASLHRDCGHYFDRSLISMPSALATPSP
jgi:hypothetical protein